MEIYHELYNSEPSEELLEELGHDNPNLDENALADMAADLIAEERTDLCDMFDDIKGNYVVYGSIGTWMGRESGFSPNENTTLGEMLRSLTSPLDNCYSTVHVYIDKNCDVIAEKAHHDGTNLYKLRRLEKEYDEYDFEYIAASPEGSEKWFDEHALPCGQEILDKYGFLLPNEFQAKEAICKGCPSRTAGFDVQKLSNAFVWMLGKLKGLKNDISRHNLPPDKLVELFWAVFNRMLVSEGMENWVVFEGKMMSEAMEKDIQDIIIRHLNRNEDCA